MSAATSETSPAVRCAVLGSPIEHSLSPALHQAAYRHLGLTGWSYERHEVREDGLAAFVDGCDGTWRGLSLTMPLKVVALGLGQVDRLAELVGAANTLVFAPEGRRLYNTDVAGLVAAVRDAGPQQVERATILGSGATARSALVSLAELGTQHVTVVARTPAKAELLRPLADSCRVELSVHPWEQELEDTDLVISTVTAGAADARADGIAASAPVVFDAIYDPWPTPLAVAAERAGRTVLSGLDLLVGQAVLQIELMTGHRVPAELLRSVGRAALADRLRAGRRAPVDAAK
jgi:shikimate dehydrogenase